MLILGRVAHSPMIDERKVSDAIRAIFQGSPYHYYLARNAAQIGFYFDGEAIILGLDPARFRVDLAYHPQYMDPDPDLWVQCSPDALIARATSDAAIPDLRARIPVGATTHVVVDRLVRRILAPQAALPSLTERDELIYPALFGKSPPQQVWKSPSGKRKVLRFVASIQGRDVYVTSGFSDPELGPSPIEDSQDELMGLGYELILFCEASAKPLAEQLIAWANQLDRTGQHILPGGWLQHTDATIPGTDLTGFVVVQPTWIPKRFPVCGGVAQFHVLLGVTAGELSIVKARSASEVTQALAAAGYTDYTPMRRKSLF